MQAPSPAPLHFVIGTDTLVRLLDPKYYSNSEEEMLRALSNMPCRFVVGGRLEQRKNKVDSDDSADAPVFVSGQEEVDQLPTELHAKFSILPDFRVDVSSTEIRKQKEAAAAAQPSATTSASSGSGTSS